MNRESSHQEPKTRNGTVNTKNTETVIEFKSKIIVIEMPHTHTHTHTHTKEKKQHRRTNSNISRNIKVGTVKKNDV